MPVARPCKLSPGGRGGHGAVANIAVSAPDCWVCRSVQAPHTPHTPNMPQAPTQATQSTHCCLPNPDGKNGSLHCLTASRARPRYHSLASLGLSSQPQVSLSALTLSYAPWPRAGCMQRCRDCRDGRDLQRWRGPGDREGCKDHTAGIAGSHRARIAGFTLRGLQGFDGLQRAR